MLLVLLPVTAMAQSSFIRTGSWEYHYLDRLEVKTRQPLLTHSFARPYDRKYALAAIDSILRSNVALLSPIDVAQAKRLLNDPEFSANTNNALLTTGGFRTAASNGNYLVINPVARAMVTREKGAANHPNQFSYGLDARGTVFHKLGFSFFAVRNSERIPVYMNNWLARYNAVPGAGNFERHQGRKVSYWDLRGTVQTSLTKHVDLQIGYDRQFIGNGYRSLFLGDQSFNAAFAKFNLRFWKLNIQSLYIQLHPQDGIVKNADLKKYLRINTISLNATKWLNIAVFDAVVLGRRNGFDLNYILPITFLRAMEQQSGSPDNALLGLNVKANLAGKIQLYGSLLLDEFKTSEIRARTGWWANKYGYQLGAKYMDAFGIRNLDLQAETNRVRPFTYTHFDSVSNYTHYNQPLAHPLGANFQEYVLIGNYQPLRRLQLQAKLVFYKQGLDSLGFNMGSNVLVNYVNRPRDYGWQVGSGDKANCTVISAVASYELLNNWFFDLSVLRRNFKSQYIAAQQTTMISAGLRINIGRREFDY